MPSVNRVFLAVGLLSAVFACGKPDANATTAAPTQATAPVASAPSTIDWAAVDRALGRTGAEQPGGVRRYAMPRSDLEVTSKGVAIRPGFALGSYVVMLPTGGADAVVMGDLVLTETERDAVLARLQQSGVEQTASHKHLLDESPRIWWTHVHAHGDPVVIAKSIRDALALSGTPPAAPAAAPPAAKIAIDTAQIDRILGQPGRNNGGIYQVNVPRAETIRSGGIDLPPSMGLAIALNFQPTGGGRAAINGDFVMVASEVNPVIRALEENGIQVVELHNHLLDEEPRLFFLHFWANDDAVKLARGLRAALDKTNRAQAGG
jgi:hypothetical protein